MSTFASIEEARAYFSGDTYAALTGATLDELTADGAICSLTLDKAKHANAAGGIMGGVMFTLADFAFAAACNNVHRPTVAQSVTIHYFSAPKGTRLTAHAHCVKDGRTTCVYDVDVTDDTGRAVARFTGSGYKLGI